MSKNRIKLYWLLLVCLMLITITVSGVGVSQARYNDTITAAAVIKTPEKNITSNCFVARKDAERTVLVGEMPMNQWIMVPFWLLSAKEDATITLDWGVADEIHKEYLQVAVLSGTETVKANEEIQLFKDLKQEFILYLAPTELARSTTHSEMKITVHVTVDEAMWGTFQVILPAVDMTISESTPEPAVEEVVEVVEEVEKDEENEEAVIAEIVENTEGAEVAETTEVTETTENTENTENEENKDEPGDPETHENLENPENQEEIEDPYKEQDALITMKTISGIHTTQQLPTVMTLAEHITSVRFGVQAAAAEEETETETESEGSTPETVTEEEKEEEAIMLESLPDYTMFSLDGGQNYYMIYGGYIPELVLHDVKEVPVLFDFRYAKRDMKADLMVVMEAYMGEELRKTVTAVTERTEKESTEEVLGPVLDYENTIEFIVPTECEGTKVEYSVEYLIMSEDNDLHYVPVELSDDVLQVSYSKKDDDHRLEFKLGKKFTQPGTYKLIVTRSYDGLCYDKLEKIFFVNCSGRSMTSGSEVPND